MIKYSEQAFAYIPHEMKARLRRIKQVDRERSESLIIEQGLAIRIPEVEKELGINAPVQKPRSRKAV